MVVQASPLLTATAEAAGKAEDHQGGLTDPANTSGTTAGTITMSPRRTDWRR